MPHTTNLSRIRRRLSNSLPLTIFLAIVIALVVAAVWFFPTSSDAADYVKDKAGFTSVTSVHRQWFTSWCHKDYIGYEVTGIRNGSKQTVTACMTEISWFDYTR